jgi:hypothetical protein
LDDLVTGQDLHVDPRLIIGQLQIANLPRA